MKRATNGYLLFFDITNKANWDKLDTLRLKLMDIYFRKNAVVILVGLKSDLAKKRQVGKGDIREYAKLHNWPYFEASSKTHENITEAMTTLMQHILAKQVFMDDNLDREVIFGQGGQFFKRGDHKMHCERN